MLSMREQHGFLRGRSTVLNFLLISDFLVCGLESRRQVDSVYFDFAKAFDSVDHSLWISKLRCFGIGGVFAAVS